jgi:isoamylase
MNMANSKYKDSDPDQGFCFDAEKVLIDPFGISVAVPQKYDRWAAAPPGDNIA